jgi:hypothetical protein
MAEMQHPSKRESMIASDDPYFEFVIPMSAILV